MHSNIIYIYIYIIEHVQSAQSFVWLRRGCQTYCVLGK